MIILPIGVALYVLTLIIFISQIFSQLSAQNKAKAFSNRQTIESFTLINVETRKEIQAVPDGSTIDLGKLPTSKINIRANTTPNKLDSVVFF